MSDPGRQKTCIMCLAPIEQTPGRGRARLYCSPACGHAARRGRATGMVLVPRWAAQVREPPPAHVREALRWLLKYFEGEG